MILSILEAALAGGLFYFLPLVRFCLPALTFPKAALCGANGYVVRLNQFPPTRQTIGSLIVLVPVNPSIVAHSHGCDNRAETLIGHQRFRNLDFVESAP